MIIVARQLLAVLLLLAISCASSSTADAQRSREAWVYLDQNSTTVYFSSGSALCNRVCTRYSWQIIDTRSAPAINGCRPSWYCKCGNGQRIESYGSWAQSCQPGFSLSYGNGRTYCMTAAERQTISTSSSPSDCQKVTEPLCASTNQPVHAITGRKTDSAVDFSTGGAAPLEVRRYFSSNVPRANGTQLLGGGWVLDFDFQLLENNSSQIFLQRPDGLPRQFNKDTAGVYRPYQNPLDISATKITTPVEQYDVLMEDDTLYRFQKIGDVTFSEFRIVLIKKQSGYQQTIAYNAAGQIGRAHV